MSLFNSIKTLFLAKPLVLVTTKIDITPWEKLTPKKQSSITSLAKLDADLQLAQKNGFAFDRGEFREGVIGFGAPICLPQGQAVAALGISMPEVNLRDGDLAWHQVFLRAEQDGKGWWVRQCVRRVACGNPAGVGLYAV